MSAAPSGEVTVTRISAPFPYDVFDRCWDQGVGRVGGVRLTLEGVGMGRDGLVSGFRAKSGLGRGGAGVGVWEMGRLVR